MQAQIQQFLRQKFLLSLTVCAQHQLWSANCFYLFDEQNYRLLITTDEKTRHAQLMQQNPQVSGTIASETLVIEQIEGVQFVGEIAKCSAEETAYFQQKFFEAFKSARIFHTPIWQIELNEVKYTSNKNRFGEKIVWHRVKSGE